MQIAVFVLFIFLFSSQIQARPEYANKEKLSCLSCHANPIGGGHRKISGKEYGSNNYKLPELSHSDNYYADFRGIFKRSEGDNSERSMSNGMSVMSALVSALVPIKEGDKGFSASIVGAYDLSSLSPGVRSTYVLFENSDGDGVIDSVLVGKSHIPFGLITDDHRTYVRLQTMTSYNRDLETGLTLSGSLIEQLHYDVSYFNGYQNNGLTSNDETHGGNANLRWNLESIPFLIGFSHLYHYSKVRSKGPSPYASSIYFVFDIGELNDDFPSLVFLSELVFASHFNTINNSNISKFVNSSTHSNYLTEVETKSSRGLVGQFKWKFSNNWQISYKYDQLLLAKDFEGDRYERHGLSLRYQFSSNLSLSSTIEIASAKKPGIDSMETLWANTNNMLFLLRAWL